MKLIDIIAGARPNFMKIAPIIDAFKRHNFEAKGIKYRLIHTGQHYDKNMSETFFDQLGIPHPDINLQVGSGTQAEQTAKIMVAYEKILLENPSDLCIVVGDVTSTMACSIAARKLNIRVAHIEGGIRSYDETMPEEINRKVTDAITNYFFTTSEVANQNLKREGIKPEQVFFVGNTMIDTLLKNMDRLKKPQIWEDNGLKENEYIVMTLHRPANVDSPENLKKLVKILSETVSPNKIIFPIHPRTKKIYESLDLQPENIVLSEPMGYLEFNFLVKNAKLVITDSGGITEETTVMKVPCLTLRDSTERPETCTIGTNMLIGTDPYKLIEPLQNIFAGKWKKGEIPVLWDGKTSDRIAEVLERIM
ncbi:UDP-N-acetylglucosamine 2-epimerase (non-hydrolyzing) [Lacihabitans sp. LS3-19]|uniref:non-hydrolyzing UDP-N-acetylglucosamine 2-epimerase n=1 Tax=Lacihabitans sp. LS3-19 TaxID=2487335 RepID=UPI0020CBB1D1|nr:UDP-N-acetylglucosamine 2-epimerase (non-hydrolyzing) [Lacihabitans sp. LS3-19]MCP9769379.1 UDP-N-acetylglucosamine 2-epimerase (non-hydrolyzing) [Lacihabitans sp. LS3-19]